MTAAKKPNGNLKRVKANANQPVIQTTFPAIGKWVEGCGHIEIGDQDGFGFIVRALDYGGLVFEDTKSNTLAEAMHSLENGLARWFKKQGIG